MLGKFVWEHWTQVEFGNPHEMASGLVKQLRNDLRIVSAQNDEYPQGFCLQMIGR